MHLMKHTTHILRAVGRIDAEHLHRPLETANE